MRLEELLNRLREERLSRGLVGMVGFDPGGWACPWLEWRTRQNLPHPKGVLLMQDWGAEKEALDQAVECITKEDVSDKTIKNLRRSKKWWSAIEAGEWAPMNAVWGLRSKSDKCGYLGSKTHAAAFPIWYEVLEFFSKQNSGRLDVVFAGDWARFPSNQAGDGSCVAKQLQRWGEWADTNIEERCIKGESYFVAHPSTWRSDLTGGPPKNGSRG